MQFSHRRWLQVIWSHRHRRCMCVCWKIQCWFNLHHAHIMHAAAAHSLSIFHFSSSSSFRVIYASHFFLRFFIVSLFLTFLRLCRLEACFHMYNGKFVPLCYFSHSFHSFFFSPFIHFGYFTFPHIYNI